MNRTIINNNSSRGIGFFGLLQIIFIVLKLLKVINWSWWLVFVPAYVAVGLLIILFVIYLIIACII